MDNERLLTYREASEIIGVSIGRVWQYVCDGRLKRHTARRGAGFRRADAERIRDTPRKRGRPVSLPR